LLAVFFLFPSTPMALAAGRSVLGRSAIAATILMSTAVPLDNIGQLSNLLWLVWIRRERLSGTRARRQSARPSPALA